VRVSLKDDMLGLGFKQSKDEQITGMNAFQDMLARLNGKSDETVAKEKEARVAVQTSLYCDSKFGPMRFVRGGWLVGDTEQETPVAKLKAEQDAKDQVESKKRKVEEVSDSDSSSEDEKARKKRRKEERKAAKKLKVKSGSSTPTEKSDEALASEKDKKKKSKSKKDSATATEDETDAKTKSKKKSKKSKKDADSTDSDAEKAAKKEKKRLKKEQKRAAEEASATTTGTSTPAAAKSGTSTPVLRGHHAVRSKWIKSKSMATMDDAALNQVRLAALSLMRVQSLTFALDFHDQSTCSIRLDRCRPLDIPLEHSTLRKLAQ
jgi:Pin2-interacting protein X1